MEDPYRPSATSPSGGSEGRPLSGASASSPRRGESQGMRSEWQERGEERAVGTRMGYRRVSYLEQNWYLLKYKFRFLCRKKGKKRDRI